MSPSPFWGDSRITAEVLVKMPPGSEMPELVHLDKAVIAWVFIMSWRIHRYRSICTWKTFNLRVLKLESEVIMNLMQCLGGIVLFHFLGFTRGLPSCRMLPPSAEVPDSEWCLGLAGWSHPSSPGGAHLGFSKSAACRTTRSQGGSDGPGEVGGVLGIMWERWEHDMHRIEDATLLTKSWPWNQISHLCSQQSD